MRVYIFMVIFLSLGWETTYAQLNESDTIKLQLRVGLSGNCQSGNVALLSIRGRLDMSFMPIKNWVFKTQNSHLYQEFYNVQADNDLFSRNYLYFKPQQKVYPFAMMYASTNYRRKIDSRYFAGAGLTYQLVNRKYNLVKTSASVVYEESKFNGTKYNFESLNGKNQLNIWRSTFYIAGLHQIINNKLKLYYNAFWQGAFSDVNDYRTQLDVGLDFQIWKGLSFNMLHTFTHENVVISKIKQEDQIITFGFAYNFKSNH